MYRLLSCVFVLLAGGILLLQAQESKLWGDLQPGSYRVGYKTIFTYDPTRPALQVSAAGQKAAGRQMQINVWYPAASRAVGMRAMRFGDYVSLLSRELDFASLTDRKRQDSFEKFVRQTAELGGKAETLRPTLRELMKEQVAARKNAPAASGRFPLIVYPDAPARHHILCEYLASHGYIVAAVSLKGTFEEDLDVALTGIETIAADIQFVIGALKGWPAVDADKVALIGLGITASGALNAQMRNPGIDALVSLEGGITTAFEERLLRRAPFFDIAAFRVPLLAIHAPHPDVNPALLDQYKYATKYYVHFPKMSEFYFLNYGVFEKFLPGIIGKAPGDTKAGFEWAARYVQAFLATHLKNDAQAARFLDNTPGANLAPPGLFEVQRKAGLSAPPRFVELKAMIRRDGIQSVVALYQRLKASDPQPFSQEVLVNLFNWASFLRDPEWRERKEIAIIRVESFPESSRAHFVLAQVAMQLNDRPLARNHYLQARELAPKDNDPTLDQATRTRIEQVSKERLESLDK